MAISRVRPARDSDRNALAQIRALLWPDAGVDEHIEELDAIFRHAMTGTLPIMIFVSEDENGGLSASLKSGYDLMLTGAIPLGQLGSWKAGSSMNCSEVVESGRN